MTNRPTALSKACAGHSALARQYFIRSRICLAILVVNSCSRTVFRKSSRPVVANQYAKDTGKTVLIWCGFGSVGAALVQLAVGSGLSVNRVAKKFDYDDPSIVATLKGANLVGAYDGTGSKESARPVADIIPQLGEGKVASALQTAEAPNIVTKTVFAPAIHAEPEADIAKAVFHEFLIKAVETGQLKPAPPAKVVGSGLDTVQNTIDELKKGMSVTKLVVTL